MPQMGPHGHSIEEEASAYIAAGPGMSPGQRINLYGQQYWWRLLSCLHEDCPLTVRIFGYRDFNRLVGIPYLTTHPPRDWKLHAIGLRLSDWIADNYMEEDLDLVHACAVVDCCCQYTFIAPAHTGLTPSDILFSQLATPLMLQPHVQLLKMEGDYLSFRRDMLAEGGDHWTNRPFPSLDTSNTPYHFAIYRDTQLNLSWTDLDPLEYQLLCSLQQGASIEELCSSLSNDTCISSNLQRWFYTWTQRNWLTTSHSL